MNFTFSTYEKLTGASDQTPAFSCVVQGDGHFFAKKGAMVADQGNFKYDKVLLDPNAGGNVMQGIMNQVTRRLTGENMEIMKVTGSGLCILAFNGQNVKIVPMQPGERLGVESENILGFSGNLKYGIRFLGSGVLSQKGLFTTNFENNSGQEGFVAVITEGNAIVLNTPCRVDPDALVCWTGADPGLKADVSWKTFVGQTSGESYMFVFQSQGNVVILQPSERKAGLQLGIDGGGHAASQHGASFGFGNQGNQSGTMNNNGDVVNQLGNMAGRIFGNNR